MIDSFAPIDPATLDVVLPPSGYPDELAAGDTVDVLRDVCGAASRKFPKSLWIEPRDWADKARENDKNKTWPINHTDRYTNQDPTHECTTHALLRLLEGCWNRQRGIIYPDGPKKGFRYPESAELGSVWFSVMSIYPIANPRKWGGAGIRQVLEILIKRGALPDKLQPRDYGFKHTLHGTNGRGNSNQSSGPWITERDFPDGCEETSRNFRPLEVIFPDEWEQAVCLVLHGMLYEVGRNGHAVPWARARFKGDSLAGIDYPDSYDVTRTDSARLSQSAWRGGFAIASMTMPDDWDKPAG